MDSKQPDQFLIPNDLLQKIVGYLVHRPMVEVAELVNEINASVKPYEDQLNDASE